MSQVEMDEERVLCLAFSKLSTMEDEVDCSEGGKRFDCIRNNTQAVRSLSVLYGGWSWITWISFKG